MFRRACVALVLMAGVMLIGVSTGPTYAATGAGPERASITTGGDANPPTAPDSGPPADISPQTSLPSTDGSTWAFAAVGTALMVTGTALTMLARRGNRTRG